MHPAFKLGDRALFIRWNWDRRKEGRFPVKIIQVHDRSYLVQFEDDFMKTKLIPKTSNKLIRDKE